MPNKLKLEDTCLTPEQAKELQALGIEMKDTLMVYCDFNDQKHEYELMINCDGVGMGACEVIPTLTNSEIMKMLPGSIVINGNTYRLYISKIIYYLAYFAMEDIYTKDEADIYVSKKLLRDALFEMIKYLKTNKLM